MTMGAAGKNPKSLRIAASRGGGGCAAGVACAACIACVALLRAASRSSASGNSVKARQSAPIMNGKGPLVPVNSSKTGPATVPIEKTVP
jgi:hypothetical protein